MHHRGRIITVVVACGLLVIAIIFLFKVFRDARLIGKEAQELSRMMSVRMIVGSALSEFYKTNNAYPTSLEKIPAGLLRWGDEGSSATDLKLLRYRPSSNRFTLVWEQGTNLQLCVDGSAGELFFWSATNLNALPQSKH